MTWFLAFLFVLAVLAFWIANLFGLPGNWMIVAASALYAWLVPEDSSSARWLAVGIIASLALLGEVVEFAASAASVKKVGGSRLGAFMALCGSVVGSIAGLFVGIPIPVVGSVIAALLFAGLGAMFGAMLGERLAGRSLADSLNIGHAAFWGRLFGTMAKALVGAVMVGGAVAVVFL